MKCYESSIVQQNPCKNFPFRKLTAVVLVILFISVLFCACGSFDSRTTIPKNISAEQLAGNWCIEPGDAAIFTMKPDGTWEAQDGSGQWSYENGVLALYESSNKNRAYLKHQVIAYHKDCLYLADEKDLRWIVYKETENQASSEMRLNPVEKLLVGNWEENHGFYRLELRENGYTLKEIKGEAVNDVAIYNDWFLAGDYLILPLPKQNDFDADYLLFRVEDETITYFSGMPGENEYSKFSLCRVEP